MHYRRSFVQYRDGLIAEGYIGILTYDKVRQTPFNTRISP